MEKFYTEDVSRDECEEFLQKLGIDFPVEVINGRAVAPLVNSDEYSKVYTILDKSDLVELDGSSTLVTEKSSELKYFGEGFIVKLDANFVDDLYRVVVYKE